jgi:hypothetical protein
MEIEPLRPEDIPELSGFLVAGFHTAPDAEFAAPDVLHWKYFAPRGTGDVPRSLVMRDRGRIMAHLGLFLTTLRIADESPREVTLLHMVDWLGSPEQRSAGARLMLRANSMAQTQYGVGGSAAGRRVIEGGGYELLGHIPVYQKLLRPLGRLSESGQGLPRRLVRTAKDTLDFARHRARRATRHVDLRRVEAFGDEVLGVLDGCPRPLVHSGRRPELLNHYLAYPRGRKSGWLVSDADRLRGFALLYLRGDGAVGKVVDCFLDDSDAGVWHAAYMALAAELRVQGARAVLAYGGAPWSQAGLAASGFRPAFAVDFRLRDRDDLVPRAGPFHMSYIEADYAYTL